MESSNYEIELRGVSEHGFEIHSLGISSENLVLRRDLVAVHVY